MNEAEFSVEVDGKTVNCLVIKPSSEHHRQANKVRMRAFRDAVDSGALLSTKLDEEAIKQGLWSEEKELEVKTQQAEIQQLVEKLDRGGMKLKEARELALEISDLRMKLMKLVGQKTSSLENLTAEAQAENERINYLISVCVVYKDSRKPYFKSYDEFLNSLNHPVAVKGMEEYVKLMYPSDDAVKTLPENKFLIEWGFVDEQLRFVNKEGKLTDREGRLINEDGYYVTPEGELCDRDGKLVDKDGNHKVEKLPFLDDDGNPVSPKTPSPA